MSEINIFKDISSENLEKLRDIVFNVTSSRSDFFKKFMDPRRDIDDECGYPKNDYDPWQYQKMYDRFSIARRVTDVLPKESWQVQPSVYEDERVEITTDFERAFHDLSKSISIEDDWDDETVTPWYKDDNCNPIWEYLLRSDILSGIGQYGVLFLGLDDGKEYDQPATPPKNSKEKRKLLFVRCLPESLASVSQFETNKFNRRFGKPLTYSLTFNDPNSRQSGIGLTSATMDVHWTRVIHFADNLGSSEIFGDPRMRPVLDNLLDLKKLYGGSAEMYWRGAFPGISLESHPTLGGDVGTNKEGMKDMMENYMNGLQRYLALIGFSAKSLAPQVVDPTPQIEKQLEAICVQLGIPKRVFMGSERGELASSQDSAAWNDRLRYRQKFYITPRIIIPFISRLIRLGILPKPKNGYQIGWPDMTSQTELDKAKVALTKTQAMAQYVGSRVFKLLNPIDFMTRIIGMNESEARVTLDNLSKEDTYKIEDEEIPPTNSTTKEKVVDPDSIDQMN